MRSKWKLQEKKKKETCNKAGKGKERKKKPPQEPLTKETELPVDRYVLPSMGLPNLACRRCFLLAVTSNGLGLALRKLRVSNATRDMLYKTEIDACFSAHMVPGARDTHKTTSVTNTASFLDMKQ